MLIIDEPEIKPSVYNFHHTMLGVKSLFGLWLIGIIIFNLLFFILWQLQKEQLTLSPHITPPPSSSVQHAKEYSNTMRFFYNKKIITPFFLTKRFNSVKYVREHSWNTIFSIYFVSLSNNTKSLEFTSLCGLASDIFKFYYF